VPGGGDFCVIWHTLHALRTSLPTPIMHNDGRGGRQRLPTVDTRRAVCL